MKRHLLLAILMAWLAACGSVQNATTDQTSPTPDEPAPAVEEEEEAPYTATSPADAAIPLGDTAVVFNSDWMVGNLSTIALADPATAQLARITTDGGDAVVRSFGNRIYVINRFGADTIQTIRPSDFAVIADFSVGAGSNPQDIAVVSDAKAYVSRLDAQNDAANTDDILIVNPLTGETLGSIDLTPYTADDGDRLARATQMVLVDGRLYVCVQDLTSAYAVDARGKIAVIDVATDEVLEILELAGRNPSDITWSPLTEKFYVANTASYNPFPVIDTSTPYGGIEVFRLEEGAYVNEGIVVADEALGGGVAEMRLASAELGFTITNSMTVAAFNPTTYAVVDTNVYVSPAMYLPDVSIDQDGRLLVAEQDFANPGIIFVNADGAVIAGPTAVGSAPVSITFVDAE